MREQHTFHAGQRVVARDGALYALVGHFEGSWWGVRTGGAARGAALPRPVEPRYAAWGGDDERGGADLVASR